MSSIHSASPPPLPPTPAAYDWEAMRKEGYKTIDFIVDYHKSLAAREFPCQAQVEPNFLQKRLGQHQPEAPKTAQSFDVVLNDVKQHITPGMTHWQHPDFFAFFPAMLSPPALLGDTLANAFNQPGFNWVASPAATELEVIVTNWLTKMFGLSNDMSWNGSGGCVLQPSATEAAIVILLAAKNRALSKFPESERSDAAGKLCAYVSDQAHFCVEKAAKVLSITHFRKIATSRREEDGNYPMTGASLDAAIDADSQAGFIPFFVSVNFGSTGICAIDDIADIASVCRKHSSVWLNVDAAYAGAAAVCEEFRSSFQPAADHADSIFVNGSKWFAMMFNSSFLFFRQREFVVSSLSATGVYLSNPHTEGNLVVDFKDYHLGLGRPFRALKVYTTLKCFGVEGIQNVIRRHVLLAQYLHQHLSLIPALSLPVKTKFGLVCFTLSQNVHPGDIAARNKLSLDVLKVLTDDKKRFMVHTLLAGQVVLRISLAYPSLTYEDMDALVRDVQESLTQVGL